MKQIFRSTFRRINGLCLSVLLSFYHKYIYKNIGYELDRIALQSTAKYVSLKMSATKSYANKFDLYDGVCSSLGLDGLWMEFGVYRGVSINYFSTKTEKIIYGFDSFEGLPEFWRDGFEKGCFAVNKLPKVKNNVELVKGWFDETLPYFLERHESTIAFLHVDCDLYSSTKIIFDLCAEKVRPGTVIVFDEYFNYPGWESGEFKAFQEFISLSGYGYDYIGYVINHEQVAIRIKES